MMLLAKETLKDWSDIHLYVYTYSNYEETAEDKRSRSFKSH
jgi:hypothetical protein